MPYVELAKLHQLHDGYRRLVRISGRDWLLLHEQGKSYLINNACPHQGAPLTRATLEGVNLRCPQHGITFDLTSGRAITANCSQQLQFLPLVCEGNSLGIYLDE